MAIMSYFQEGELEIEILVQEIFFFLTFLAAPCHGELLDQGLELSHSCDLHRVLAMQYAHHCASPGIEPVVQGSRNVADPLVPQEEVLHK